MTGLLGSAAVCVALCAGGRPSSAKPSGSDEAVSVGVLPVGGARGAMPSGQQVAAALKARGYRGVVAPQEVLRRLAKSADTRRALKRARTQLARAEEATLRMDRGAATVAAQKALGVLHGALGPMTAPRLVARARVAEALALLLDPPDPEAASRAFSAALAADPTYRPGAAGLPPRAEQLLSRARRTAAGATPPAMSAGALRRVAQRCGLASIVRLTLRPVDGGAFDAEATLVGAAGGRPSTARRRLPAAQVDAGVLATIAAGLLGAPREKGMPLPAVGSVGAGASGTSSRREAAAAVRWYQRWWVWTAAAVVVAGAVVGVTAGLAASEEDVAPGPAPREPIILRFEFK